MESSTWRSRGVHGHCISRGWRGGDISHIPKGSCVPPGGTLHSDGERLGLPRSAFRNRQASSLLATSSKEAQRSIQNPKRKEISH